MKDNSMTKLTPDLSDMKRRIYLYIMSWRDHGATCDEIEVALDLRHQTASARINEMAASKRLRNSGRTRLTRGARRAIVWVVNK